MYHHLLLKLKIPFVALFVFGVAIVAMFILGRVRRYCYPNLWAGVAFLGILLVATVVWLGVINTAPMKSGLTLTEKTVTLETYPPRNPSGEYIEEKTGETGKEYGFFSLETRSSLVQIAFGRTLSTMDIPQKMKWGLSWLFVLLMAWGLVLMTKRWGLREERVLMMLACYSALAISVISPAIGLGYGVGQVHFQTLVVLAPCFVIGVQDIAGRLKIPESLLLLSILVPYLLSMTGLMDSIFGIMMKNQ